MFPTLLRGILPVMTFLFCFFTSSLTQAEIREYWIAAEKTSWNYAPSGKT